MGILIGFVSGKGGAGKTTVTEIVATAINHYYDYKVAVVEVDYDQRSMTKDREVDKKQLEAGDSLSLKNEKYLKERNKDFFPIYLAKPTDREKIAKVFQNNDITFIDIPGSFSIDGVEDLFYFLDYAYVPLGVDRKSFDAQIQTLKKLAAAMKKKGNRLKEFGVFFNRYYGEKGKDNKKFKNTENIMKNYKIPMLPPVYYNIKYQREWASTINPPTFSNSKTSIYNFIDELLIRTKMIENNG
jgi:cellulose biosynthesis protein BcsQ